MNKIINGKRYDTNRARKVAEYSEGGVRDFHHFTETLYRKKTGEYFIYGEGGPASRYAERIEQNTWSGGEKIIPLSVESAKDWAEKYLSADEYEEIFGQVEEDDSRKIVTFSLPLSVIELIRDRATTKGITLSDYVAEAVQHDLQHDTQNTQ